MVRSPIFAGLSSQVGVPFQSAAGDPYNLWKPLRLCALVCQELTPVLRCLIGEQDGEDWQNLAVVAVFSAEGGAISFEQGNELLSGGREPTESVFNPRG